MLTTEESDSAIGESECVSPVEDPVHRVTAHVTDPKWFDLHSLLDKQHWKIRVRKWSAVRISGNRRPAHSFDRVQIDIMREPFSTPPVVTRTRLMDLHLQREG